MYLVKTSDLNEKMKIARPVFNKKGDLLYAYGANVSPSLIADLNRYGIAGVCVIESTDNASAFTEADVDFERFRSKCVYAISDELKETVLTHRLHRTEYIADDIIDKFAHVKKINFYQDIRSETDFVARHTYNVCVLASIIADKMGYTVNEKRRLLKACIVHDIGKSMVPPMLLEGEDPLEILRILDNSQDTGFEMVDSLFPEESEISGICIQAHRILTEYKFKRPSNPDHVYKESEILLVADYFDVLTAIDFAGRGIQRSFASALNELIANPDTFKPQLVKILSDTLELFKQGDNVVLSNGNKALIMSLNVQAPLYPTVMDLSTNKMIDLSDRNSYGDLEIASVSISTDTRHRMR